VGESDDLVPTLVDLARQDRRADFDFLARANGVTRETLDSLWNNLKRRLPPTEAPPCV